MSEFVEQNSNFCVHDWNWAGNKSHLKMANLGLGHTVILK